MTYEESARTTHQAPTELGGDASFSPGSSVSAQSSNISQLIRWVRPAGLAFFVLSHVYVCNHTEVNC